MIWLLAGVMVPGAALAAVPDPAEVALILEPAPDLVVLPERPALTPAGVAGPAGLLDPTHWAASPDPTTATVASPFAFDPTRDHRSTWTDFQLRRGVGFQDGLRPAEAEVEVGFCLTFTLGGARHAEGSTGAPSSLRHRVLDWTESGLESLPELVASGMISAFED